MVQPQRVSEKTLELEIVYELKSLGAGLIAALSVLPGMDSLTSALMRTSAGRQLVMGTPMAQGPTLRAERRLGWDVWLDLPWRPWSSGLLPRPPRALALQFKRGEFRRSSQRAGSRYHRKSGLDSRHYRFRLSTKGPDNQHDTLRVLADAEAELGVLYVLPGIVDEQDLQRWRGRLATRTCWVPVQRLDAVATAQGVDLHDGRTHHLAVSMDMELTEAWSQTVSFQGERDHGPAVVAEIVAASAVSAIGRLDWVNEQAGRGSWHLGDVTAERALDAIAARVFRFFDPSNGSWVDTFQLWQELRGLAGLRARDARIFDEVEHFAFIDAILHRSEQLVRRLAQGSDREERSVQLERWLDGFDHVFDMNQLMGFALPRVLEVQRRDRWNWPVVLL